MGPRWTADTREEGHQGRGNLADQEPRVLRNDLRHPSRAGIREKEEDKKGPAAVIRFLLPGCRPGRQGDSDIICQRQAAQVRTRTPLRSCVGRRLSIVQSSPPSIVSEPNKILHSNHIEKNEEETADFWLVSMRVCGGRVRIHIGGFPCRTNVDGVTVSSS